MLIEDFRIALLNTRSAIVSWTVPNTSDVSWIYSNGVLVRGPLYLGTLDREIQIPFTDAETQAIEVHNFDTGQEVSDFIEIRPNTKPIIQWVASIDGASYKIYHTPFGGSEKLIYDRLADEGKLRYSIDSPIIMPPGWNFVRVEALDQFGNESVRGNWNYLVFDLPDPASNLTVADGSGAGLFDIAITI